MRDQKSIIVHKLSNIIYHVYKYDKVDVCGITGTGKTTTVISTLQRLNVDYSMINCLTHNPTDQTLYKKLSSIRFDNHSEDQCKAVIIDQCDFLSNINRAILVIRSKHPACKIIFICNNNNLGAMKLSQPVATVFFLPYTQEQLISIVKLKSKQLFSCIPNNILVEGAKKSTRRSGDFRQMQNYILNWSQNIKSQIHKSESIINKLADPTKQILQSYISRCGLKKKQILMTVIQLKEREQMQSKKKKKLIWDCECRENLLTAILNRFRTCLGPNQCLMFLKQWEQTGFLRLQSKKCSQHTREGVVIDFGAAINKDLIKDTIMKSNYSHGSV